MTGTRRTSLSTAWRGATALALVVGTMTGLTGVIGTAQAASTVSAAFSSTDGARTATVGGKLYARQGAALTLSVTTDSTTSCLRISDGTNSVDLDNGSAKTSWTVTGASGFTNASSAGAAAALFTTAAGNGASTPVTVTSFKNANGQSKCTANGPETFGTQSASYVRDNTGPTISPVIAPAADGAGWNKTDTTVTWTASDPAADLNNAGSGVATQPTASITFSTSGIFALTAPAVSDRVGNAGTGSGTLKLDKDAPTITGSRTPAANGFGWNNAPVTVSFSCVDSPATNNSGIAAPGCPAGSTVSTDGTNQSVSGSVSDVAGNSASASVSGISIDRVNPTLTGAPTTAPNANGWYNANVTIHWTAADDRSGVDPATVPGDSTISGEGSSLTASASVSDKAGNTASATSAAVKVDKTAPSTGITGASNNWTNGNVTVTLSPVDPLSGVSSTTYAIDGGATQTGTSFTLSSEGDHVITYASTDKAGNVETTKTAHVKIDKTAPTIGHVFAPAGYTDGAWINAATVTVTFNCSDSGSGVASCTAPTAVTTEGTHQVVGTATDNAGNGATNTATVNIDRTPPTISALADRQANGNGWYADDVLVSFTCADQANLSGVQSCAPSHALGEGKAQSASGTATDNAGNAATATLSPINVDKTAPTLSGAPTTSPNSHGWYDNSVTVAWTCSDALSGIDGSCPASSTVGGEGTNLGASASASDKAGNTKTASVAGIHIDTTAPVTSASANAPLATGWYADKAHVTLTGSDNLSGIDATYYDVDGGATKTYSGAFDLSTPGVHTLTFWSVDNAGNIEDSTAPGHTLTLKVDNIAPTISGSASPAPNAAGWNSTDVDVTFDCADGESGIATCDGATTLTHDGGNQSVTGTATDNGGNSSNATVSGINVDKSAPSLSGSATTSPNGNGWYNGDVAVHWTATDATSGVDGSTQPDDTTVTGEGGDLTAGPVSVKDIAGNTATASLQHLRIDRSPPALAGAATTAPNGNGWYNGDVTIDWACADGLSGVAPVDCPADSTITGEGSDLSATASVSDRADNSTTTTVDGFQIDRTPPSTDVSAPSGWHNTDATVTLSADDNLSGVAATHYTVNGGPVQTGTSVSFSAEGTYGLEAWSVDKAGNVEAHKSAQVLIDKSAPTIAHSQSPAANADGWNNTDVTITFTCNDTGGSGIASCTDPITETHEGKDQAEAGTATDNAGNSATDPATVSIDKSKPTIVGTPDRAANANGWYADDVTVTFACDDQIGLSGVKSCGSPVTLGEGAGQSAAGTATDAAGNSASTTVSGIDVDETAPSLSGAATTSSNADGWYKDDVTVAWTCSDALSHIDGDCPADSTVTGEGGDLGATATVSDRAGNSTSASVNGIQIDRTAPVTTATLPTPDSDNGWYASAATVNLTATDSLSGVDKTFYKVDNGSAQAYTGPFAEGLEGVHTVTFWSTDKAGNAEDAAGTGNVVTIRVDTTNPAVSGSRQPAANGNGWNNEPVHVSFACSDTGSGIASCADLVTVATQGADQSVTGTATDKVGNTGSATVGHISIDLTNPALSGAVTTAPNADGWYKGDVTVHWTCSDPLSGIDGSCPADSTVTGEGDDLSASSSVTDRAGNQTAATVDHIKIDRRGPETSVSAPSDWQTSGVALDVTATDNLSGVKATYFTVNGGAPQTGNKISLTADGTYALSFWSVDYAGNEGTHGTASVKIDKTAPTISHAIKPDPNDDGWNNSDATVHFLCDDPTSGVKSCTADQVVTTEAADQKVVGTAVDNAGNSSSDTATVNLDKTKPTITGKADRPANADNWYNANVTVNFTCTDSLSGIASCNGDQTVSEGGNQSVSGNASDKAGNAASATVSPINVDETDPTLSGAVITAPNGNGWYAGNVTVHWTCSDALSGIAGSCPADSTVTGEGSNLSATTTVTDRAGNQTTRTVSGIQIDRTAPVTTAGAPAPLASGWYGGPVTVTLSANDNLSGVDATYYSVDGGAASPYGAPFQVGKGVHTVTFWSKDAAGNVEDKTAAGHSLTVKVDNVPPTISGAATTAADSNGWYNGPVTVSFTCADAESSVASCTPDQTLTGEGANQSVTGTAKDQAGNTASATVSGINIDRTSPTFPAYTGSTTLTVGQPVVEPACNATDALSGIATCVTGKSGSGFTNPNGVGDFTFAQVATDKAGNVLTRSLTIHVGYKWSGFLQPVTNTAHDLGTASAFNAGQTVPVKFQLKNASGGVLQASYMPVWLQPVDGGTTSTTATATSSTSPATVGGSFKWDATAQQYVFNWQTPKSAAGHYYRIGVQVDSGEVFTTLIVLK
ncbi:MAG: OmpL47-type beta-barrel domain-containing protein [Frankiaceae bacterium]